MPWVWLSRCGEPGCRLPFDNTYRPYEYAKSAGQLMDFEINRALLKDFMFPETFIVSEDPLR